MSAATPPGPHQPRRVAGRVLAGRAVWPVAAGGAGWATGDLDDAAGRACLRAALDAGASCVDTALADARREEPHSGERLVGEVLAERGGTPPLVVTTCGHHREPDGTWGADGRPEVLGAQVRGSLRALRAEVLDVVLLHHPDPEVPLAESVGALADLRTQGLVREVGVSNTRGAQLDEALAAGPVAVVQVRVAALDDDPATDALVQRCAREGLGVMGCAPLGGPGALAARGAAGDDLAALAAAWGTSPQQLLLAWLLERHPTLVAVVGSTRPATAAASVTAARIDLSGLPGAARADLSAAVARLRAAAPLPTRTPTTTGAPS